MLSVSCFYNPFVRAAWRTYVIGSINDHVYNSIPYWNIHWTETPTSLSLSDLEANAIVHKANHSLDYYMLVRMYLIIIIIALIILSRRTTFTLMGGVLDL